MTELEFQVIKSTGFVLALGATLAVQAWRPHGSARGSWRVNGSIWALNAILLGLVCAGCACVAARWADARGIGLLNLPQAPLWVAIPIAVLGLDLVSYGWHRANHTLSFLWRFHQAHHSDPAFTVTTALRFHPVELLLALPLRLLALVLLGVPVAGVIAFELIFAFANFFEHGDIDLPRPFERTLSLLFITPALHRRHHSVERALLNSNYGTIFSFWDRLFGSYGESSSDLPVRIGLPGLQAPLGPAAVLALPVRGVFRGE